jgi:hypothetical protein
MVKRYEGIVIRGARDDTKATPRFQHELVVWVLARLGTIRDEREASVRARRVTGDALIVVKQRVVEDTFGETRNWLVSIIALD